MAKSAPFPHPPRRAWRARKPSALAQQQLDAYLLARDTLRRVQRAPPRLPDHPQKD